MGSQSRAVHSAKILSRSVNLQHAVLEHRGYTLQLKAPAHSPSRFAARLSIATSWNFLGFKISVSEFEDLAIRLRSFGFRLKSLSLRSLKHLISQDICYDLPSTMETEPSNSVEMRSLSLCGGR